VKPSIFPPERCALNSLDRFYPNMFFYVVLDMKFIHSYLKLKYVSHVLGLDTLVRPAEANHVVLFVERIHMVPIISALTKTTLLVILIVRAIIWLLHTTAPLWLSTKWFYQWRPQKTSPLLTLGVQLGTHTPTDARYDFINFPLLNPRKSNNHHKNNYQDTNFTLPQSNNRFSILSSFGNENTDTLNYSTIINSPSRDRSKNFKKLSFEQSEANDHDKAYLCSPVRPCNRSKDGAIASVLCSPNGRTPHYSSNGVGYSDREIIDPQIDNFNLLSSTGYNEGTEDEGNEGNLMIH